jgi:hypothetical protein
VKEEGEERHKEDGSMEEWTIIELVEQTDPQMDENETEGQNEEMKQFKADDEDRWKQNSLQTMKKRKMTRKNRSWSLRSQNLNTEKRETQQNEPLIDQSDDDQSGSRRIGCKEGSIVRDGRFE